MTQEHGAAGYSNLPCRCDVCREGWRTYNRSYRQKRKSRTGERILEGRFVKGDEERPVVRARGRNGGRKPKLSPDQIGQARRLYDEKGADGKRRYTITELAAFLGVSRRTIYRALEPEQPGPSTSPRQETA